MELKINSYQLPEAISFNFEELKNELQAKTEQYTKLVYTDDNIEGLLFFRAAAKKIRNAGGRLKGAPKRTKEQDKAFAAALERLLEERV